MNTKPPRARRYVVCLHNRGYAASLVVGRLYEQVSDPEAEGRGLLRVIDESGEDYVVPQDLFAVEKDFQDAAGRVLKKNRELYRRLS